jgi:hypothetical protein
MGNDGNEPKVHATPEEVPLEEEQPQEVSLLLNAFMINGR